MITIDFIHYRECPPAEKYHTEHQLGLLLLSSSLHEYFNISIDANDLSEHINKNNYGKPYLKDYPHIHFNISHCDGLVACATDTSPIGIDIEKLHPFKDSILRKVLTEEEKNYLNCFRNDPRAYTECFYRFWTLKESRIKQSGMGLSMPLTDFYFRLDLSTEHPNIFCSEEGLYFYQQTIHKEYILSVCSDKNIVTPHIKFRNKE